MVAVFRINEIEMWLALIIVIILVACFVIKPLRNFVEKHYKFWQSIAAIGTVIVLYIGFESLLVTRELFKLQNQPYIGIYGLYERNTYDPENRNLAIRTNIHFLNSGNLPGQTKSVELTIKYKEVAIDTIYNLSISVFPKSDAYFQINLSESLTKKFEEEVYNRYTPKNGYDYVHNIEFQFHILYHCQPLNEDFEDSSKWRHKDDCNNYVQVE
ncbi:hypothetical protein KJ564_09995 [bacterium]|nr:hypothetical protein [bacterium]